MRSRLFLVAGSSILVLSLIFSCAPTPAPTTTPAAKPTAAPTTTPAAKPATTPATTPAAKPTAAPPPAAPITLTMLQQYASPTDSKYLGAFKPFADAVEAKSGGRVKVRIYMGTELGPAESFFDMVQGGAADICWFVMSYGAGRFPLSTVIELPFASSSSKDGTDTFLKLQETGVLDGEYKSVKVLSLDTSSGYQLFTIKKEVRTPSQLKGLKIRVAGGTQTKIYQLWGAVPVSLPGPEVYTSLSSGIVDGTQMTFGSAPSYKLDEITKYMTKLDASSSSHVAVMNLNSWNKLPPDLQKIVADAGREIGLNIAKGYDGEEQPIIKKYQDKGLKLIVPTKEEMALWKQPLVAIWDEWVGTMEGKGLPGKKVFEAFSKILKDKGNEPLTR